MPRDAGVVLVAAGRGVRAGGGVPKQLRAVGGTPVVLRALAPFLAHPDVACIALVVAPDVAAAPPEWLAGAVADSRVVLVPGGAERGDSVRAGLAALPADCTRVLVHDAARPFVDAALIGRVLAVVAAGESAVPALAVSDTLKRGTGDPPRILDTVPRGGLWRAQTPQGFPRPVLEEAHRAAAAPATDDAALVEQLGHPVRLVPGSPWNIKLTTPDDFELAELFAARAGSVAT